MDAAADFGFLEIAVVDGFGSAEVSASMQLKAPGDATPGGRVFLMELFEALADDVSSVVVGPDISGNMDLQPSCSEFYGDRPCEPWKSRRLKKTGR